MARSQQHITITATYVESGTIIIPPQPTKPTSIMSEGEEEPMEADAEPVEADPVPAEADPVAEEAVSAASVAAAETAALSDRDGQRLISTQTVQHDYLTLNGKVARETIAVDGTVTTVMDFIYDESGRPFALKHSDDGGKSFDTYYYVLNLQGDVVKLVWYIPGFEYEAVATYTYDAWGSVTATTAAGNAPATTTLVYRNPIRYRGYVYDNETGFYYLQSRYYDPANHRFINADGYASTGQGFTGTNMFVYCLNNPVQRTDSGGTASWHYAVTLRNEGPTYDVNNPSDYSEQLKQRVSQILSQDCYSEAIWTLLSENERKAALDQLVNEISSVLGITKHEIAYLVDSPYSGTGTVALHADDAICIIADNSDYLAYPVIATVVHELYHAYQNDVIAGTIYHNEPAAVVLCWTINKRNYYSDTTPGNYYKYYNQPMEISAYWFAGQLDEKYYTGSWGGYYG